MSDTAVSSRSSHVTDYLSRTANRQLREDRSQEYVTADGTEVVLPRDSKIDVRGLLDASLKKHQRKVDALDERADTDVSRIEQFQSLQRKLAALQKVVRDLTNDGSYNTYGSVYAKTVVGSASILEQSDPTIDASRYLSVSYADGAAAVPFSVVVDRVATKGVVQSTLQLTDLTTDTLADHGVGAGDLLIAKADGSGNETITIDTSWTLPNLIAAINAVKSTTKVEASYQKIDDTHYALVLNTTETGFNVDLSTTDAGLKTQLGIDNSTGTRTASVTVTVGGVSNAYTSTTNTIDIGGGRTVTVTAADAAKTFNVTPSESRETLVQKVKMMVVLLNEAIEEVQWQEGATIRTNSHKEPILTKDPDDNLLLQRVKASLSRVIEMVAPAGDKGRETLSALGIEKVEDPSHESIDFVNLDEDTLRSFLTNYYDSFLKLMMNNQSITGATASKYLMMEGPQKGQPLSGKDITVVFSWDGTDYKATFSAAGMPSETVTVDAANPVIRGSQDGAFAGIALKYYGTITDIQSAPETITLNYTISALGFSDIAFKAFSNETPGSDGGVLMRAQKQIADTQKNIENEKEHVKAELASIEKRVLEKIAKLMAMRAEYKATRMRMQAAMQH